jgi:pimeloyl-ACP methyl ester carboxylesterase
VARGRELAAAIPGARLIELPETGHLLATDAEAEVGAALRDHLQLAWYGSARKAEI